MRCHPEIEKAFKVRRESKKSSICTTRRSLGLAAGSTFGSSQALRKAAPKVSSSLASSQLVKLEEEAPEPEPDIDFLRRHKAKADELTRMMLRTCQSREQEDMERRPANNLRVSRNLRFTTDYDGTRIPFRKHKEESQPPILSRIFVTERVVEPKPKARFDSVKLESLKIGNGAALAPVVNEPVSSRLQLQDLMAGLELARGVRVEVEQAEFRATKPSGGLGASSSKLRLVLCESHRNLDSVRSLFGSKCGTNKKIEEKTPSAATSSRQLADLGKGLRTQR